MSNASISELLPCPFCGGTACKARRSGMARSPQGNPMTTSLSERAEFEAWARDKMRGILKPHSLRMLGGDERTAYYADAATAWAWAAWRAALAARVAVPEGWRLVPVEPTPEMAEAFLQSAGLWVEPYVAEKESGVPIECEITKEDADEFNAVAVRGFARDYAVILAAAQQPEQPKSDHLGSSADRTVPSDTIARALQLCDWIAESPHQRGSINGLAAQVRHELQSLPHGVPGAAVDPKGGA